MKLRALPLLAAVAISAFALTSCTSASSELDPTANGGDKGSQTPDTSGDATFQLDEAARALLPQEVRDRGYLTAVYSPTFAPFEYYDTDNSTIIGFDVDFMRAVGQVLGLDIKTEAAAFEAMLPGIQSGKYEISNSGIAITEERKKSADFVAFASSGSGIAVAKGNPKNISNTFDALCGLKIAAGKGTNQGLKILPGLSDQCTAAGKAAIEIQLFPSQNDGYLALQSNRVDGYMTDSFMVTHEAELAGGDWELAPGNDFEPVLTGIVTPKDSPLTPAIRAAVIKVIENHDAYVKLNEKWSIPLSTLITPDQVDG